MKVLVTGSAGFIGFHVSQKLLEMGFQVIGMDNFNDYYDVKLKRDRNNILSQHDKYNFYEGDLKDINAIKTLFDNHKIDKVCHLAAQAGVRYSLENPHAYIQSNIVGFMNLIEMVKEYSVEVFVYASSSSVYGNNKKIPFSVEDKTDEPISLYAATKKANELMAYTYHHLYGIKCTGLRFFTVYGPWGRPDMALFRFTQSIINNQPIDVYNNGKMKRNFTYIDDVVNGVVAALEKAYDYEVFNIGNNKTVELMKFVEVLENCLGLEAKKNLLPIQPGDVIETVADIDNTIKLLDFEPKTDIEVGINNFVNWYKQYYNM